MPYLPELSDRVWYALHCLPRDKNGAPPSYKQLEKQYHLSPAVLSKTVLGKQKKHDRDTFRKIALAVNAPEAWLDGSASGAPKPTGVVPPRPGREWLRHGDLPAWRE